MTQQLTIPLSHQFEFGGKAVIFGGGSVSRAVQQVLPRHMLTDYSNLTVADMDPRVRDRMDPALAAAGARFAQLEITPDNVGAEVARLAGRGGLVVNLTTGIHSGAIIAACHDVGALYLDTSNEVWELDTPEMAGYAGGVVPQTLYARHMAVRELTRSWPAGSPTALMENGANPGLISYWLRRGLTDLTVALLSEGALGDQAQSATQALEDGDWPALAEALGVRVIIDAERDTQAITLPRKPRDYYNTWSVIGFVEEGLWGPVEVGWGTHEKDYPDGALTHPHGPRCQIALPRLGVETWAQAWTPTFGTVIGNVVRHGENFSIAEALTRRAPDRSHGEQVTYRPTVFYCYRPCDAAAASMFDCRQNGFALPDRELIVTDEQIADGGVDELGALILGGPTGWYCGSSLSVDEARKLAPGQNPTTLQVAASITAGIRWILAHPNEGLCNADYVADRWHEDFLGVADPYLGERLSVPTSWTPDDYWRRHPLAPLRPPVPAQPDWRTWQFRNFLV